MLFVFLLEVYAPQTLGCWHVLVSDSTQRRKKIHDAFIILSASLSICHVCPFYSSPLYQLSYLRVYFHVISLGVPWISQHNSSEFGTAAGIPLGLTETECCVSLTEHLIQRVCSQVQDVVLVTTLQVMLTLLVWGHTWRTLRRQTVRSKRLLGVSICVRNFIHSHFYVLITKMAL